MFEYFGLYVLFVPPADHELNTPRRLLTVISIMATGTQLLDLRRGYTDVVVMLWEFRRHTVQPSLDANEASLPIVLSGTQNVDVLYNQNK